jgi:hypothetical protein
MENRIISFVGVYSSSILMIVSENQYIKIGFLALSIVWLIRYFYLQLKD